MHLPSLTQHQLLIFWTQLLVLLAVARGCGTLLRRFGQPAVVGQLLAGVLVGPSVLGKLWPAAEHVLAPSSRADAASVDAVAWLGVGLLLVLAGFDTDLALVRRLGRPSSAVAVGGFVVPLAAGAGLALALPTGLRAPHSSFAAFALFVALSLGISSLPVIAKILDELGFMRRDFGQITVAVGALAEIAGWLGLGVAAAIAQAHRLDVTSVLVPVLAIVASLGLSALTGQSVTDVILRRVRRVGGNEVDAVSAVVLVALTLAVLMQAVHSDAVLGAYIAGILVGRSRFFQRGTRQHLESMTMGVFAPVFFATAGLRIDLSGLAHGTDAFWAAVIFGAAVVSKAAGTVAGAAVGRLTRREATAMAIGLNCRGAVGIVVATVGLSVHVLSSDAYTIFVLLAIATSVAAPPLLRAVVRDWRGTPEEQRRLGREETVARNLLVRPGRMLVALEPGQASLDAARVAHLAWPAEASATVLVLDGTQVDEDDLSLLLEGRDIEVRSTAEAPARAVLDEARLGYSVVVLGVSPGAESGDVVSPLADAVLQETTLPVVMVRQAVHGERVPLRFRRVVLPVSGGPASRTAEELAYHLAAGTDTPVVVTHVMRMHEEPDPAPALAPAGNGTARRAETAPATAATAVVRQAVYHAQEHDIVVRTTVRHGVSPADEIIEEAKDATADLVVMGTTIRRLEGRAFLGHTVERVLATSDQSVVVVATPETVFAGGMTERFDSPA